MVTSSDPYPEIEGEKRITRHAIELLKTQDLSFTILTKAGTRACRDFDLLEGYDKASFGTTLTCFSQDVADKWEPNAAPVQDRIEAIKQAKKKGIKTWVSIEPVYNPDEALKVIKELHSYVDHWKVGKINYNKKIENSIDWLQFRQDARNLLKQYSKDEKGKDKEGYFYLKRSLTAKEKIEVKRGVNSNVLLVAPHGFYGDDDNTGELANRIADQIGCYRVINEVYQRSNDKSSEKDFRLNLNSLTEVESSEKVKKEYLQPIQDYTDEIIKIYGKAIVLWIHGIGDDSTLEYKGDYDMDKTPEFLIGFGQGSSKLSADSKMVEELVQLLCKETVNAEMAAEDSKYCAQKSDNLTQLFSTETYQNGHKKDQFDSIQLEIKYSGFRDVEHLDKTANIIADALMKLTVPKSIPGQHQVKLSLIKCQTAAARKYIFRESDFTDEQLQKKQAAEIRALADSIQSEGLLQPIVLLQRKDNTYIILCGYRRYQAMKLLKAGTIEAKTYREDELTEEQCFKISITENGARRDLSAVDIADCLAAAQKQSDMTNKELAEAYAVLLGIGRSEQTINKYLQVARIKKDSPDIINAVRNGKLPFSVAAEVLAPINSVQSRNSFYKNVVIPFRYARPELAIVKKCLEEIHKDIDKALENKDVVTAILSAFNSDNPRGHFLRQLGLISKYPIAHEMASFYASVSELKQKVFENDQLKDDLSISVENSDDDGKELLVQVRITSDNLAEMLNKLKSLADQNESIQTMLK